MRLLRYFYLLTLSLASCNLVFKNRFGARNATGIDRGLQALIDAEYDHTDEKFRSPIVAIYTQMRDTWKRVVEDTLFNRVVQRFRPEVMTQRIEEACIDPENDYPVIFEGMKHCSHY